MNGKTRKNQSVPVSKRLRLSAERCTVAAILLASYSLNPMTALAASVDDQGALASENGTSLSTEAAQQSVVLDSSGWHLSASNNTTGVGNAIDIWGQTRWTTSQPQQPGQTFTIDMKDSMLVDRIQMAGDDGSLTVLDYPRGYEVQLSADGVTWGDPVATGAGSVPVAGSPESAITDITFTKQPARFIRITQTGSDAFYWWSIYDLKVFGNDNDNAHVANAAPDARFSLPTPPDNELLALNSDIRITVVADDSDGFIENASLFLNNQLVGDAALPPYSWDSEANALLGDLAQGSYDLRAEVTDNLGAVTTITSSFVVSESEIIAGIRHPDIVNMLNIRVSNIPYGPDPDWWGDSYSVGDQCFCETSFDHDIDLVEVDTPFGTMNVREVCNLIGPGPGSIGRPKYNDVQCGNGPVNGQVDEDFCPGQVNAVGTTGQRRLACNNVGPKWNFDKIDPPSTGEPVNHPDIVDVLDRPLSEIPYAPDAQWWGDSYSVGDQCFCETTFDHEIGGVMVDTPQGPKTVQQACALAGEGPGSDGRPKYNDVQCGNGPANGTVDEAFCPGQINVEGTDEERRLGCNNIGPKWKIEADEDEQVAVGSAETHPDIVTVLDRPLSEIPYGPDAQWWGDSYSANGQCYCDTTFDHDIGTKLVETPVGVIDVEEACLLAGEGPGIIEGVTPRYNDVQCGNGPVNGTEDEAFCPGQINVEGTDEERRLGCNNIGPTWKF
ncbi:MAG: discoidin domain-containing protein [Granulosicoccus sp.]